MVVEQRSLCLMVGVLTNHARQQGQLDRQMICRFAESVVGGHVRPPQQCFHVAYWRLE